MKTDQKCSLWARVTISPNHALRANQNGLIVDQQRHGQKRWLVQFDERYPGGGIDGDKLWLDEHDFSEVVAEAETVDSTDSTATASRSEDLSPLGELH